MNQFTYQNQTIHVGDKIAVSQKIVEEGKTRLQSFEGLVIAIKNRGLNQSFTVRKISTNKIGVERIFPVSSPIIDHIDIKTRGIVRRAKLYYLRQRKGRLALRVKEKRPVSKKTSKGITSRTKPVAPKKLTQKS